MIEILEREKQKETLQGLVRLHKERGNGTKNNGIVQKIHDYVVEKIRTGKWLSGDRIIESSIAKKFEVSHVPVREAMEKLQLEDWVERIPNIGICVRVLNLDTIKHAFQAREMIEAESVMVLAKNITDEQLDELRKLVDLMEAGKKAENYEMIQDADGHFHRLLVHFVGNPTVERIFENLLLQTHGSFYTVTYSRPFYAKQIKEKLDTANHLQIYQALAERNVEKAEVLIRKHVRIGSFCAVRVWELLKVWEEGIDKINEDSGYERKEEQ